MHNSASPHTQANAAVDQHLLPAPTDQYLLTAPVTAEPAGGQLAVGTVRVQGGTTQASAPLSYTQVPSPRKRLIPSVHSGFTS